MPVAFRRVLSLCKPPIWTMLLVPATMLLSAGLSVLPPLFVGGIIDALQRHQRVVVLQQLLFYILVGMMLSAIGLVNGYSASLFRESLTQNLRVALVTKLNRARFDKLSDLAPGAIGNRATSDTDSISAQLQFSLFPTLLGVCNLIATIVALVRVDPRLAAIAIVFASAALLPVRAVTPRLASIQKESAHASDELYGQLHEGVSLQGLALFRNGAAWSQWYLRFVETCGLIARLSVRQTLIAQGSSLLTAVLNMLGPATIIGIGAFLVGRGQLSAGAIVTVLIYQSRLSGPLSSLSSLQLSLATIGVLCQRLLDIFGLPEEHAGERDFVPGDVELFDVSVSAEGRAMLRNVTMELKWGTHVALVGPSGCGKSTLASLMVRLSESNSGRIKIGGVPIEDISPSSLRSGVALVPQDPLLLDATLLNNLKLFAPWASRTQLDEVLALCQLHDVINRLPEGMQTRLGQRGFRLSGGERQRICVARAVLSMPQMLILDEALSGVDIAMEAKIVAGLRERYRGRTLVSITHRLASASKFDRVITIGSGAVAS